ncbi:MAG TPA: NADH-quinone oxidoreductase subunit H [Verrucomicrobiae bacterium]|nr:NADH-quinone oxidoreductase subunit H [Verrucomicrobiae bacterium]
MTHTLLHIVLLLGVPPLLPGVIGKTKAWFAGRNGPPVFQLYYDLAKLLRKGSVFSTTTTWVFRAGPVVGIATALLAGLLVPFGGQPAPISFAGDLILFAYLFGLGRFFTASAALDTGSSFEGMGAAREVTFACLAEPALFFGFLVLAKLSASLSLTTMLHVRFPSGWGVTGASLVLLAASLFIVLLVENSRIPFDDPNTHLELTMIHEVMVLDHGGPALGMILYGAALKLFVIGAVLLRVVAPVDAGNAWADAGIFVATMLALAVAIGVVESVMARFRLVFAPTFLVAACLLSAFSMILLLR